MLLVFFLLFSIDTQGIQEGYEALLPFLFSGYNDDVFESFLLQDFLLSVKHMLKRVHTVQLRKQ